MMMQMDSRMMGGMMGMGWIWSIVGLLLIVLLAILIFKQLRQYGRESIEDIAGLLES